MTKQQLLLIQLAEELGEVQRAIHKALMFGLDDVNPKTKQSNIDDICDELTDFVAVADKLYDIGIELRQHSRDSNYYYSKMERIEKYLEYSKNRGILSEE